MWQIAVKESLICKSKSEIPLDYICQRHLGNCAHLLKNLATPLKPTHELVIE